MKQNSDTRARRQHSTVPVDKGLSALKLICGLTGNIVRPGVNRNTLQNEPSTTLAPTSAHDPAEPQRPAEFSITTVASEARPKS